jgi:hypothetical protein
MNTTTNKQIPIPNSARTTSIVWGVLSVLFLVGIFTPFIADFTGADTKNWMFATMFFSFVLCITSIVVAVMYAKRARITGSILRGENLLAHWTYTEEEWARYAKTEHKEFKQHNRSLFILVTVISVIIGVFFIIMNPDDWIIFVAIVLGIIIIAGGSAFLAVALSERQNRKYHGEVFITADGLLINRILHLWKGYGATLEGAVYEDTGRAIPVIVISYSAPSRSGSQMWTVRVPVPHGHEAEAEVITQQLLNRGKPNEKI